MTRLALVAADWALADAGVNPRELPDVRHGRGHRELGGRLRVRPARAAEAVEQGQRVRQRVPVLRLVLRGQHRPDLHPPRDARPQRRGRHRPGRRPRRGRAGPAAGPQGHAGWSSPAAVDASLCPWGWVAQHGQRPAEHGATTRPGPTCPSTPGGGPRARRGRRDPRPGGRQDAAAAAAPGSTARSPATPPPSTRGRAAGALRRCARRSSWPWPTPRCSPPTSTWCSPTRAAIPELDRAEARR